MARTPSARDKRHALQMCMAVAAIANNGLVVSRTSSGDRLAGASELEPEP
jgi:hypothetical protein